MVEFVARAFAPRVASRLLPVIGAADNLFLCLRIPAVDLDAGYLAGEIAVGLEAQKPLAPLDGDNAIALVVRRPEMQRAFGDVDFAAVALGELVDEFEVAFLVLLDLVVLFLGGGDVGFEVVESGDLLHRLAVALLGPCAGVLASHHGKGVVVAGDGKLGGAARRKTGGDLGDDTGDQFRQLCRVAVADDNLDRRAERQELQKLGAALPDQKFLRVQIKTVGDGETEAARGAKAEIDFSAGDGDGVVAQQVLAGQAHREAWNVEPSVALRQRC